MPVQIHAIKDGIGLAFSKTATGIVDLFCDV